MGTERKFALITGAAGGLGRAMALRLARDGWHIGLADLDADNAAEARSLVEQAGGSAEFLPLDVRDDDAWYALRQELPTRWPQLDLLINNAGVCVSGEVGRTPMSDWDWVLSINLRGVILGCHSMVDWLKANPRRSFILNIASAAGILSPPCMAAYNVAKAGVISLSESLYVELRPHDIGVTVVCPWFIRTGLLEKGRFQKAGQREFAVRSMDRARITPDYFAASALAATFRGRLLHTVGRRPALAVWLKTHFRQPCLNGLSWFWSRDRDAAVHPDHADETSGENKTGAAPDGTTPV